LFYVCVLWIVVCPFVLLFFFFWPLRCLFFFDMRILITLWYLQALLVYYRNYFKSMVQ
jgi:hypothetical protein